MLISKKTVSTITIKEYTFRFEKDITVKAEIMDGQIKCLIRSNYTQEAVNAAEWRIIRETIENDVKNGNNNIHP